MGMATPGYVVSGLVEIDAAISNARARESPTLTARRLVLRPCEPLSRSGRTNLSHRGPGVKLLNHALLRVRNGGELRCLACSETHFERESCSTLAAKKTTSGCG